MRRCTELDTPVGRVLLAASAQGLTHLLFAAAHGGPRRPSRPTSDGSAASAEHLRAAQAQLAEYFEGRRRTFDVPLAPGGTPFQRAVWTALSDIPFGALRCYGELARAIERPRAVRAVGAANGANPISIIVPCHRVIGRDGRLTGYAGGLEAKRWLLEREGACVQGQRVRP